MIRIIVFILFILPTHSFANGLDSFGDQAIAGTFKNLARVFIQTSDIDVIKAKQIKSLLKMDDKKFQKRFEVAYQIIKEVPLELRVRHGLRANMSKQEVVKLVQGLNKNDLNDIVDNMPDELIIRHFKVYAKNSTQEMLKNSHNIFDQAHMLWDKMFKKM